jgi:hypothetical protein
MIAVANRHDLRQGCAPPLGGSSMVRDADSGLFANWQRHFPRR